ncbi:hypothetical protein [Paenarthrobacter ilicis]|uniref:Uncharacterized protein n=1 Tax=Paenarthrobacter ilicis TaxID=43665 RepID=A0ABX0TI42_9MICC|nr:hypothetical protein [Paenarthrobacter ilicis]MBM7794374.1 hypothetical protein [Paenarthrobacter ilicis]NIJ02198.1 hypothetical protein [Paenarthrobacter ilicis]
MKGEDIVITLCVALTPAGLREIREEQWRSDLIDGPGMGIPRSALLVGAVRSSAASRLFELKRRGSLSMSRIIKGDNMKLVFGAVGAVAALAAIVVGGIQANTPATITDGAQLRAAMAEENIGGYEGWWNSSFLDGTPAGPPEIVAVNTNTGTVVDYFNRAKHEAGQQLTPDDTDYTAVPDPSWPTSSVVIIDTATGKMIDSFPVDHRGRVIYTHEDGTTYVG